MSQDDDVANDGPSTPAWYRRAAIELAGTSALQVSWALGIADDDTVVALIDRLPLEHRQPSLVFSVARWLGAPAEGWPDFRSWLVAEWPRVEAAARERRTQTNEVGRCAPLLAALDRITGPLALLELGASAGLCLGVDAYSYRFDDGPVVGEGQPLLSCTTSGSGEAPRRLPEIVWRRGIDLAPLSIDPASESAADDLAWLEALLPPDRPERLERLREACETLAADAPEVIEGDALEALPAVVASAPSGAALVIVTLGTLVYLPPADRVAIARFAADIGARLVTLEPVTALPDVGARLTALTAPDPTHFVLALDGEPIAYSSAHGDRLSWLTPVGQPDAGVTPA
jgi:hypothetical protein